MTNKLKKLRQQMDKNNLYGFIIPMSDEFQSEYVPEQSRRLEWLTGFTGSAGSAIVTQDNAAFFTDGRYTIQALEQIDNDIFEIHDIGDKKPLKWLEDNLSDNHKLGYDPFLHTENEIRNLRKNKINILPVGSSIIDRIWTDKPASSTKPIFMHDIKYSGQSSDNKIKTIANDLVADAVIISLPESTNWLLNIRGNDLPHTPFALSYAILYKNKTLDLFIDKAKVQIDLPDYITIYPLEEIVNRIASLKGKKIQIDPATSPSAFFDILKQLDIQIMESQDPCLLPKACKNSTEIEGIKNAHIRDGNAVRKFLNWLENEIEYGNEVTEISASDKLEGIRSEAELFQGLSFDTISAYGSNGATIHYKATEQTNRKIEKGSLYLVDSGGQYLDGTTDITRTIAIGEPTERQKLHYTLVLKGHIALANSKFPIGTTGSQLDILARQYLWEYGLDYNHGTGHGVGSFMNVHEGPQRIGKKNDDTALEIGMIISNEPGFYLKGEYGIRLENLIIVVKSEKEGFLEFRTITLVPFDNRLINNNLITTIEQNWLAKYNKKINQS